MVVIAHKRQPKIRKIPTHLVYEELEGQALPYLGYLEVLSGKKQLEQIMGSSSLQSVIIFLINGFIFNTLNRKKYRIATNEAGLHIDSGDNLANDIAVFDKAATKTLDDKYFNVPPKLVIEVDTKVDLAASSWNNDLEYILAKSQKMLDFGVESVIWITTKSKKIFVISPTKNWYLVNFNEDIPLLDGHKLNLGQLLAEDDITY